MTPSELLSQTKKVESTPQSSGKGVTPTELFHNPLMTDYLNQGRTGLRGYGDSQYLQNLTAEANPEAVKAANQNTWHEFRNGLAQLAASAGLSTIESVGYLGLGDLYDKINNSEQEFGNSLSNWANKVNQQFQKEVVPVYNNPETKDVSEWAFENINSLGSSLGFIVPSLLGTKLLGLAARTTRGYNIYKKILGATKGLQEGSEAFNTISGGIEAITAATISRHAEGMMEGKEQYDRVYQESLGKGFSEETAKQAALKAAKDTYNHNWPLILLDALQFGTAFKSYKYASRAANELERKATQKTLMSKIGSGLFQPLSESFEEGYQSIIGEEASRDARIKYGIEKDDYSTLPQRLKDYVLGEHSDEFWTSAFFGALGGAAFEGIGNVVSKAEKNRQIAQQNLVKSKLEEDHAIYKKDPIKFREAKDREIYSMIFNALENRRADDVRNMFESVKNSNFDGHTEEETNEIKQRADFALSELDNFSKLYDNIATKTTPDVARYILANRAHNKVLNTSINELDNQLIQHLTSLSNENNLDASYSKLLDYNTQLQSLELLKNDKDFKANNEVIEQKQKFLQDQISILRDTIRTNNNVNDSQIDEKLSKIDKSLYNTISLGKTVRELQQDQNTKDYNEINTPQGKEKVQKDIDSYRKEKYDRDFTEVVSQITPDKSVLDIQGLREKAKELGKSKEFETEFSKKFQDIKSKATKIDPNNLQSSLEKRYKDNPLLKSYELTNINNIAIKTGGLQENSTLDEQSIAHLALTNPKFKSELLREFSSSLEKITKQSLTKQPTVSTNKDTANEAKKEQEQHQEKQASQNIHAWYGQGDEFKKRNIEIISISEHDNKLNRNNLLNQIIQSPADKFGIFTQQGDTPFQDKVKWFDTLEEAKNNLIKSNREFNDTNLADKMRKSGGFEALNSGKIPLNAKISYEYDFSDPFNKGKDAYNSLIELVWYENNERRVIGGLTGWSKDRQFDSFEAGEKLKKLREDLFKEIEGKNRSGIYTFAISTKMKGYTKGQFYNTSTYNSPYQILKEGEPFKLAIVRNINNTNVLDFNGDSIGDKVEPILNGTPGEVYQLIKNNDPKGASYRIYKLFVPKLNTKPQQLDTIVEHLQQLEKDKNLNPKDLLDDISQIVYIQNLAFNGNYQFTIGDIKNPSVIEVKPEELKDFLGNLVLQVDVNKINQGDYNNKLAEEGYISTDLNPIQHFHSTRPIIEAYTPIIAKTELTTSAPKEEKKESKQEEFKAQILKGYGSVSLDLETFDENEKFSLAKEDESYPKLDIEKSKQWFAKKLPQAPVNFLDNLIEVNKHGGLKAYGRFKDAAIELYKLAPIGTDYHEAFHYAFNLFLTKEQREIILNEASQKYNIDISKTKELEEKLAEEFANYVINKEDETGLGYNIKDFFKKLWNAIKSIFTNKVDIDQLFYQINTGYYKDSTILQNYDGELHSLANKNPYIVKKSTDLLTYQFFQSLNKIRESKNEYKDLDDIPLLKALGTPKEALTQVIAPVYNGLVNEYENGKYLKGDTDLLDIINNIFTGENGVITGTGDYYNKLVNNLSLFGINISGNVFEEVNNPTDQETDLDRDIDSDINEEEVKGENYDKKAIDASQKDSLKYDIRKVLRFSEKWIYNREEDKFIPYKGYLGFREFVNFDELDNYLRKNLSDIYNIDDMFSQLEELKYYKPEIYGLLGKLYNDNKLSSQFFTCYANAYLPFYIVRQSSINGEFGKETKFQVINANRRSISQLIIDDWNNNLISPSKNKITNEKGDILTNEAKKYVKEFDALTLELRKTKELTPELAIKLSDNLSNFGITIDPQIFINEFDSKEVRENGKIVKLTPYENLTSLLTGAESLNTIINAIASGANPYQGDTKESNSINKVTKLITKSTPNLHQDSIIDSNGKQVFSYTLPTFMTKKFNEFLDEKERANYLNNWWFKDNIILNDLQEDNNYRDIFKVSILDGLVKEYGANSKFSDMSPFDLSIVDINLHINSSASGRANERYGLYRTPTLSDSTLAAITPIKKGNKSDVINALYNLALTERERMLKVASLDINIKNFNKNGSKYNLITIFNEHPEDINDSIKAKQLIEKWMQNELSREKDRLTKETILNEQGRFGNNIDSIADKVYKDYNNLLEEYFYNTVLAKASLLQLTSIDPAFYKNYDDFHKRNGQGFKFTRMLNTKASYEGFQTGETYRFAYLKDEESPATELQESLKKILKDKKYSSTDITAFVAMYDSVNQTDAQSYITLDRFKKIKIGLGEWNQQYEKAYKLAKKGKQWDNSFGIFFQPMKPFYYNEEAIGDIKIPVQHKNSEIVILPVVVNNNPKLKQMLNFMESKNIDSILFNSAVKTGEYGATKFENIKDSLVHTGFNKYWGIQTEVPLHHIEEENLLGTQVKKLITADIPEGTKFFGKYDKQQIFTIFQKLLSDNITNSYDEIKGEFEDINKIQKLLLKQAKDRGLGESHTKALELKNREGQKVFNIPLFDPIHGQRMNNILNSIVRNNVTKQKINGGAFVLASNFGFSEDLKVVIGKDGSVEYMEALLPAWSKSLFPKMPNGEVDIQALEKEAPELLDLFGYRIPTEHKYSMKRIRVKGFLPDIMGGVAILPKEITKIAGEDFDIDKLYIMIPNFENKDGKLRKLDYNLDDLSNLSKKQRDNAIIDIMKEIWSHPAMSDQILVPGNFDTLKALKKEVNERYGIERNDLNPIFPINDITYFAQDSNGSNLIGLAANHNVNHGLAQYTKLTFKEPILFNGEEFKELNKLYDTNNRLISRNLAEFIAAFVDNVKDPVATELNINLYTFDVIASIIRVGYDLETAINFINQPILREFTEKYNRSTQSTRAALDIFRELNKKYSLIAKITVENKAYNLRVADLKNQIGKDIDPKLQLMVLSSFRQYKEQAEGLSKLVRASRADTLGTKKTMAGNMFYLHAINIAEKDKNLTGVKSFMDLPLVDISTEFGIRKPQHELLSKYLPFNGRLFHDLVESAEKTKGDQLTEKEVNFIYNQFINYYTSSFEYFNTKDKAKYINDFPEYFNKKKSDNSINQYELIKYLRYVPATQGNQVPRIELASSATITNEQRELVRMSWEAMLLSEDKKVSKFGNDLIKYSFYTSNFGFTYSGFSQLIPLDIAKPLDENQEGLYLKDAYRDHLYKLMDERHNSDYVDSFLQQLYRNIGLKGGERLVPVVKLNQVTNNTKAKDKVIPSLLFSEEAVGKLQNKIGGYIKVLNPNGKNYIYKYSGETSNGNIIYNIVPSLGYENNIIEFDRDNQFNTSSLAIHKLPEFNNDDYFVVKSDELHEIETKEKQENLTKANAELNQLLKQFAASLGIKIDYVNDLKSRLGGNVVATSKIMEKLILISQGKENINTLPEEIGHFAEAYSRGTGFHNTLMDMVQTTEAYQEVKRDYSEVYGNNETKLKQEAIGKLIGEAIIRKYEERRKNNNIIVSLLQGLWNKFISIFKKADPDIFINDVKVITDYIAEQILDRNTEAFKTTNQLKIQGEFHQIPTNTNIDRREQVLKDAIDSINKKILLYQRTASHEFTKNREELIKDLIRDLEQEKYESGILNYVKNAKEELEKIASRFNNIDQKILDGKIEIITEKRELINQLRDIQNYLNGFYKPLSEASELKIFDQPTINDILITKGTVEILNKEYLRLAKMLIKDILKEYSTNPKLNIGKALDILDKDISYFQRWLDALAETSDSILSILDKITKDVIHTALRKTNSQIKDILDLQKGIEKDNLSSHNIYERDFNGNITGNIVREYNYGEFEKQKKAFFNSIKELEPKEKTKRIVKWFEENTQTHPDKDRIIREKKEYFDKHFSPIIAKEKYLEWEAQNIKDIVAYDEYGEYIESSYRGELQIPAEKYRSSQYEFIQKNKALKSYYDKVKSTLDNLNEQLPEIYKLNGKMPQLRKDFYERLSYVDENGIKKFKNPKDQLHELRTTIAEQFVKNTNDIIYGLTDESGNPVNFVPVYFTKRISPSDLSLDATSSLAAFISTVNNYSALTDTLGVVEATKDILAERAVLTGKFDPVTLFKNKEKDEKGKPISVIGKESLAYARLEDYIKMVYFGQQHEKEEVLGYDISKIADTINRYTSLNSLAGNIYAGISNITMGTALTRIEGYAKEYYDHSDLLQADKIYTSELPNSMGDVGQRLVSSKLNLWSEYMDTLQNYDREFKDIDAGRNTLFSRLFKESSLYFINHAGEHFMQLRSSLALANRVKLKDKQGNIISLWDAFERVNVGTKESPSYRLKLQEGLTKVGNNDFNSLFKKNEDGQLLTEKDINRFINRQNFVNKRLHGIYNNIDKSAMQRFALGRMAIMFRKYIKPGWNRRFAKLTYNEEGEIWTEGNYNTLFRFIKTIGSDLKKLGYSYVKNHKYLNESEKANIRRCIGELAYIIGAATLAGVLTQLSDDDDDNKVLAFAAYESYRLYSELRFFNSITEAWRIAKSPVPALYQWEKLSRFLQIWDWTKEYDKGQFKGYTHFEKGLIELAPLVGTYYNFKTPEEQLRYFTNTGLTIL